MTCLVALVASPVHPDGYGLVVRPQERVTPALQPIASLFAQGQTWAEFLTAARVQRERWLTVQARASAPPDDLRDRLRRVSSGLQVLIVAEDWCPDSVEAVPYVVGLAEAVPVPVRLLNRHLGAPLLEQFRSRDGRSATPTIVIVRDGIAAAAWVERPAIIQDWFFAMGKSADASRRFNERQLWFDRDRGRTVLHEFVALAERP